MDLRRQLHINLVGSRVRQMDTFLLTPFVDGLILFLFTNMWLLFLLVSQTPTLTEGPPKHPPELQKLVDAAAGLPAEFQSQVLLELASSRRVADPSWKKDLIEAAFEAGSHAQLAYAQWLAGPIAGMRQSESTQGWEVWDQQFNALALQAKAIRAMVPLDPQRALSMYQRIPTPSVPALSCQDPYAPELYVYYQTAYTLFNRAFSPEQREKGDDMWFVRQLIGAVHSPAQVVGAIGLLRSIKTTPQRRTDVLATFSSILSGLSGPDRVYGPSDDQIVSAITPAAAEAPPLVLALRGYLVRQLSGERCHDNIWAQSVVPKARSARPSRVESATKPTSADDGHGTEQGKTQGETGSASPSADGLVGGDPSTDQSDTSMPKSVVQFNALVAKLDPAGNQYKPISHDEVKPAKDGGTFDVTVFWRSQRSAQIENALRDLNSTTAHGLASDQWPAHYMNLLKQVEEWTANDEQSPDDYLVMKAIVYRELMSLAPQGPMREAALRGYLTLLEQSYPALSGHIASWARAANGLYSQWRDSNPADRAHLFNLLTHSSNPVISAMTQMQTVLGETSWFPAK